MPTLKITFHGLCFFVPHEDDVFVLMPATHGPHEHHAFMMYNRRQEDPAKFGTRIVPLVKQDLVFDGAINGTVTLPFGNGIARVTKVTDRKVPKRHLRAANQNEIRARVILRAGHVSNRGEVACWKIEYNVAGRGQEEYVEMTDYVEWTHPLRADVPFKWGTAPFGTAPTEWTELVPRDGDVISMEVHHVYFHPEDKPDPGDPAPHFGHYYQLIGSSNAGDPEFVNVGPCTDPPRIFDPLVDSPLMASATLYSCMVAAGEADPAEP